MQIIIHRVNRSSELQNISCEFGVEVDLRSRNGDIILSHDPFTDGELFSEWLRFYKHKFVILNVKEEGLEASIKKLLDKFNIDKYFFLDQTFPFLLKFSNFLQKKCAIRLSEFESIETAFLFKGKADWVWVDFFSYFPLTKSQFKQLKSSGYRICIVSPELHGEFFSDRRKELIKYLQMNKIMPDAVCTKNHSFWSSFTC